MKIYDISKELFSAEVFPGDPEPKLEKLMRFDAGDGCNLSALYSCLHAGTHLDAPFHFIDEGAAIDELPLDAFIGECTVISVEGIITGADIDKILPKNCLRLLIRGKGAAFLSQSAAFALATEGVILVGTDAQSIATEGDLDSTHRELLLGGVAILEGLDLSQVSNGKYFLFAPPVKIAHADGAPTRAVLIEWTNSI